MHDLTKGNLTHTFIKFAIPAILAGVLGQAYALIDSVIIGKFLGTQSLAALGATSGFLSLIDSLFWGYGVGCGIYVAKLFGAGEKLKLRNAILATLLTESIAAVILSVLLILLHEPLLDILQVDPLIRREAAQYFCIIVSSLVIQNFAWLGVYITNALGISSFPLYMSLIMSVINISGNLLSVLVLDAGIIGVALSTLLASTVVAICYIVKFLNIFRELNVSGSFSMAGYWKGASSYALPSMFQQCLIYIAQASVAPLINAGGFAATAAYSVSHKYYNFIAALYQNSTKVMANFTSQCTGSGEYRRIREGIWITLRQSTLIVLPLLFACVVFPEAMCSFFFNAETPIESYAYAVPFLRFYLPFVLFNLINNLFHALLKGIKSTKLLMLSSFIGCVVYVAVSYAFCGTLGLFGVYLGWALSWGAEAVFAVIVYFSGKWQPPAMREALQK
ncbi:MAG: hypothetical protein IKB04_03830 [Clostridia bacterium]|nr:hypothetical protein [Clostridia bacterium]